MFKENILRAEYRYVNVKNKNKKGSVREKKMVFVDTRSNNKARFINAEIKIYDKVVYRYILALTGNYLRDKGYKVSVVEKRK